MSTHARFVIAALSLILLPMSAVADDFLDMTKAVVVLPSKLAPRERLAVRMLVEEVEKRSGVRWEVQTYRPKDRPTILIGLSRDAKEFGIEAPAGKSATERYRLATSPSGAWMLGDDSRGVMFGVGRLLRELRMRKQSITLPAKLSIDTAPQTPLRGHQIGYRPKTNSYDAWTVPMWEQYIRDLVVFGCNAVELIPPRSDDDADSPHFPLPPLRMMTEVSKIADSYGLQVWIWYPALDADYTNPKTVEFALKEWGEVFRALPRVDAVFVPGGDPGHTPPKVLFALLEKQTANLQKYHPRAGMWVSPQGFTTPWMDEFFALLREEPKWLTGVAHGPQIRVDFADFRKAVPKRYPIRDYPDITHSRHCQYPVPDWDLAFALIQGREITNPRPLAMALMYRRVQFEIDGFITYSEGCHDDVNKCIWSALGWDNLDGTTDILREYARYFIHPDFEKQFSDGLIGLERNWVGPARTNKVIDETLEQFRAMEKTAPPSVKLNWRFQQALYRAYYDAFIKARLKHETGLEEMARAKLRNAKELGTLKAMDEAVLILDMAKNDPVAADLRARVLELGEALFQSIRAQLSVKKYNAIAVERGATLDTIDFPLNDAGYLKKQFAEIRKLPDEAARLARLNAVLNRTDPGPGGFYDDLGDPMKQPHLYCGENEPDELVRRSWMIDPMFFVFPLPGFGFRSTTFDPTLPRAWQTHAESLYDAAVTMRYDTLDPKAAYRVRVVYNNERPTSTVRLTANDKFEIHGLINKPRQELEFAIPKEATAGGTLTLKWTREAGAGGSGRGCQVAEVWLLREEKK